MSDSVRPYRRQPPRLARPWDSPGKNTRVGFHFLLQWMKVKSESEVAQSCPTSRPHGLQPTRLLHPWDFPGKSTGVGCHCLLPGIEPKSPALQADSLPSKPLGKPIWGLLLLLLSHFSRVRLCATPETAAHQAPLSLGFSRQEHWSGLPFPSPMHESEK